jgi:hypothetical protein
VRMFLFLFVEDEIQNSKSTIEIHMGGKPLSISLLIKKTSIDCIKNFFKIDLEQYRWHSLDMI